MPEAGYQDPVSRVEEKQSERGSTASGIVLMEGSVRTYAWGSRTALAELTGRPSPTSHPEAELWFGAHPGSPSALPTLGTDLLHHIAGDPENQLGSSADEGRLPFLLKLLAADQALSLQAHPTKEQAAEGYARENQDGIALGSPVRNYKDDNHKPELLVALTRFEALVGFWPVNRSRELLDALAVPELERYTELLTYGGDGQDGQDGEDGQDGQGDAGAFRALVTTWITLPTQRRTELMRVVLDACRDLVTDTGAVRGDTDLVEDWMRGPAQAALDLSEQHPGDAGVLISLLLNHVVLEPGDAVFLSAGNLHAYMRGTAVEVMANSDNVLRGGLTTKHVDVPELMKVVDFAPSPDPLFHPDADGTFAVPVPEFRLRSVQGTDSGPVQVTGPAVVLVADGEAEVTAASSGDGETIPLTAGQAVWVPAAAQQVVVRGDGHIFISSVG